MVLSLVMGSVPSASFSVLRCFRLSLGSLNPFEICLWLGLGFLCNLFVAVTVVAWSGLAHCFNTRLVFNGVFLHIVQRLVVIQCLIQIWWDFDGFVLCKKIILLSNFVNSILVINDRMLPSSILSFFCIIHFYIKSWPCQPWLLLSQLEPCLLYENISIGCIDV